MASFVFIQNHWYEAFGPMYLSAVLKANGHDCRILIGQRPNDFVDSVRAIGPDVVAFSIMTGMHRWAIEVALHIKYVKSDVLVVMGGAHATFSPEIVDVECVDAVCRGEGDHAVVELANALDASRDFSSIRNFWVKTPEGDVIKNPIRRLVCDLDTLPLPDRSLYDNYPTMDWCKVRPFMVGRGCPYSCTFCFNSQMRALYQKKGAYVRYRSPELVIEEIEALKSNSGLSRVCFSDDTFTVNGRWLRQFLPLYRERVGVPFHCLIRIDHVDEELCHLLKECGCAGVFFGIETADDTRRTGLLGKKVSNDDIRHGAELLHKFKLKFKTYNMIGLPGESLGSAMCTVKLNMEISADYPSCSIFIPYPRTPLAEHAIREGMVTREMCVSLAPDSFHEKTILRNVESDKIANLHKLFQTAVLCSFPGALLRVLVSIPQNSIYRLWYSVVALWCASAAEGKGFLRSMFLVALRSMPFVSWLGRRRVARIEPHRQFPDLSG